MSNEDWIKSIPSANDLPEPRKEDDEKIKAAFAKQDAMLSTSRADALRMLGLNRKYDDLSADERTALLKSPERINAFDYIDTSTNPRRPNIEKKRGIVSELIKKKIIPLTILKERPLVYLGSGTDIEFPLAIGARDIRLVDYIFSDENAREEVIDHLKRITTQDVKIEVKIIRVQFDFGDGPETATIELDPSAYNPAEGLKDVPVYNPPEKIGIILAYAAQGPHGRIKIREDLTSRLEEEGAVIEEEKVTKKEGESFEEFRLGEEV
jgi:hypothetical protein